MTDSNGKKIVIVGSGANGSCLAADLTLAGEDVVVVDQWPEHVASIQKNGLRVVSPDGDSVAPVRAYNLCDLAGKRQTYDVALIMVKAYDTGWAAEFIKPRLQSGGIAVGVQNGMTAELIRDVVGPESSVGCVVELSAEVFTPGLIKRNTSKSGTWFGIGNFAPTESDHLRTIAAILSKSGKVSITQNILSAKWMKLVVNTMCLAPCAILGMRVFDALKVPGMREFALRAGAEALELGQLQGRTVEPIFGLAPEDIRGSNQILDKLLDKLNKDVGPNARDAVLQDYLKDRESEVDTINGVVVQGMHELKRYAPINAALVEINRRIQAGELRPDPSNLELATNMAASK